MRNLTLRLLTALVALAQPLPSYPDGATLMVSAVVLPNARCSFSLRGAVTARDLVALAAQPASVPSAAGSLRCGGHVPSVTNAQALTRLSIRQTDAGDAVSDFVVTITP
jgi:hypothetical protein